MSNELPYINIHTHRKPIVINEFSMRNGFHYLNNNQIARLNYNISCGVHPWHYPLVDRNQCQAYLEKVSGLPKVIAIGETGLDRTISMPLNDQFTYLELHATFASRVNKPLIVHAVRTYDAFVPLLKRFDQPIIFHGYYGNDEITASMRRFNVYFSMGKNIFTPSGINILQRIPDPLLFLETDNATHIHIADIYDKAAAIKGISVETLQEICMRNFKRAFGEQSLLVQHE